MPTYNYTCETHGTFSAQASMAEFNAPQNCPICQRPSPRDLVAAPQISTKGGRPKANQSGEATGRKVKHAPGCPCCS